MKRSKKRLTLCTVLLVGILLFIWGNSLLPGEVSGAFSKWIQGLFGLSQTGQTGHGLLRKLAHFTEFACLGVCLGWLFGMLRKKQWCGMLCVFATACIDETIQCFVPGRGPGVADVLLDTAGGLIGIGMLLLGYTIYKKQLLFGGI